MISNVRMRKQLSDVALRLAHLKAVFHPFGYHGSTLWLSSVRGFLGSKKPSTTSASAGVLKNAFIKAGSDKSTGHDYHIAYGLVLDSCPNGPLLEIGIGSQNPGIPANMLGRGITGGSLRAWRNTGRFTEVHGADIDPAVMFSEPGIYTHMVDQRSKQSLSALKSRLEPDFPSGFSVVIDDGLHTQAASMLSAEVLLPLVAYGGIYVIEDVHRGRIPAMVEWANDYKLGWAIWHNPVLGPDNTLFFVIPPGATPA